MYRDNTGHHKHSYKGNKSTMIKPFSKEPRDNSYINKSHDKLMAQGAEFHSPSPLKRADTHMVYPSHLIPLTSEGQGGKLDGAYIEDRFCKTMAQPFK